MTESNRGSSTGNLGGLDWQRGASLTPAVRALLEAKNVVVVSSLRKDGTIHAIPVWVDTDGEHVLLNSVEGRAWERNLSRDPNVTCTVVQSGNPYEFVEIRGQVVARSLEEGEPHIHRLAKKYLDLDEYPWLRPEDKRVLYKVAPVSVFHMRPASAEMDAASSDRSTRGSR